MDSWAMMFLKFHLQIVKDGYLGPGFPWYQWNEKENLKDKEIKI